MTKWHVYIKLKMTKWQCVEFGFVFNVINITISGIRLTIFLHHQNEQIKKQKI